jgi:hypothetical protein
MDSQVHHQATLTEWWFPGMNTEQPSICSIFLPLIRYQKNWSPEDHEDQPQDHPKTFGHF